MYNYTDLKRYEEAEKAADAFFNDSDNADYSYLDYRYYGALLSALKKYDRAVMEYGKALEKTVLRMTFGGKFPMHTSRITIMPGQLSLIKNIMIRWIKIKRRPKPYSS